MYAMNFEFQFWLDMSTIGIFIERNTNALKDLQWGEQVSAKSMCDAYDMLSTQ